MRVGFETEFTLLSRDPSKGPRGASEDEYHGTALQGSGWIPADGTVYAQSSAVDEHANGANCLCCTGLYVCNYACSISLQQCLLTVLHVCCNLQPRFGHGMPGMHGSIGQHSWHSVLAVSMIPVTRDP